jgi:DNA topoisomerase-2
MAKKKKIEEQYKKLSQREHVLQRSDTYIGSINSERRLVFTVDDINNFENLKIVKKEINYNAGLIKIFDEIITNASDHSVKTGRVKVIKVEIENNRISVWNDGDGIPVVIHKDEKVYVPELIFGHLLTGENYDDTEQRIGGGRNGIGSKACNIFSKEFMVETADGKNYYKQVFTDNLSTDKKGKLPKPHIRATSKKFTKISFLPDYERFGFTELTDDIKSVMIKRTIDIAAYNPNVKVYFNNNLINIKTFKDYMKLFMPDDQEIIYEKINDFWEVGIMKTSTDSFEQISLVNGLATLQGGTHVNYIINQITSKLKVSLSRGNKFEINPNDIKSKIFLFLNSKIFNPEFDSQVKEILNTKVSTFKDVEISDNFIKKILKSDITQEILDYIELKEQLALKKSVQNKNNKTPKVQKLVDANKAGTKESDKCFLFITEGDSASSFAVSGFKYTGRDYYGSFPIKGKPINVRDISISKLKQNEELSNIAQILGLEYGKKYTDTSSLRYGKLVLMTDADCDGYHIKGLILNYIEMFFPSLLNNFMYEFITPILRITKNGKHKYFYKIKDYDKWKDTNDLTGYTIKHFKGLGTLSKDEVKMVFENIDKHLIKFHYTNPEKTKDVIDLAFRKNRADDRKKWMGEYDINNNFDKLSQKTTYESFMNNEFIEYSLFDVVRNVPNIMDGLKPSQRKILYTLLKLNKSGEINVGELFGYVKSIAIYNHGPQSLEEAIITMAQDFVGSNNLPLIEPIGSFGTRLHGGEDSAAARYIHTELRQITKTIFKDSDKELLNYLESDGKIVEPQYYIPCICLILVNGCNGIGTGFSTTIPKFNINDLIVYLENKLKDKKKNITLTPFYNKFKGKIQYDEAVDNCITTGIINRINDNQLNITELPVGTWNENYYNFLDKLIDNKIIKNYIKKCNDDDVNIIINLSKEYPIKDDKLYDLFQLTSRINMSNMHLFDINSKIKKYDTVYDIINEFYINRLPFYEQRRQNIIGKINKDIQILTNRCNFIDLIINNKILISNKNKEYIEQECENNKLDKLDNSYDYLLNMVIYSLSKEKYDNLKNQLSDKLKDLEEYSKKTIQEIWLGDLSELKREIKKLN